MKATEKDIREWFGYVVPIDLNGTKCNTLDLLRFHNWMEEKKDKYINSCYSDLDVKQLEIAKENIIGYISFHTTQKELIESIIIDRINTVIVNLEETNDIKVGDRYKNVSINPLHNCIYEVIGIYGDDVWVLDGIYETKTTLKKEYISRHFTKLIKD